MGIWKKKKESKKTEKLGDGIFLYDIKYTRKSTVIPLIARGIVIFLLVIGTVGGFFSTFGLEYNKVIFAAVILGISLYFSIIYIRPAVRNLGYLLFFIIFVIWAIQYRYYINSGFYAVINEMALTIADYFQLGGANEYSEYFSNRYVTVTMTGCFLGIVEALLMNISMTGKIKVFGLAQMCVSVYLLPVYLEEEPGLGYMLCIMAGLGCAVLLKASGHFKDKVNKRKNFFKKKKEVSANISYGQSPEIWMQTIGFTVGMAGICILCVNFFLPQNKFLDVFHGSSLKTTMDAYFLDLWQFGLDGVFGKNASGGMSKGKLGRTGSVQPDYETDLVIKFTPYSTDTLYLKAYTGIVYGDNQWESEAEVLQIPINQTPGQLKFKSETMYEEAKILKELQAKWETNFGKGIFWIENVDADMDFLYYPYYTLFEDYSNYKGWKGLSYGEKREYTYYPMTSEPVTDQKREELDRIYFDVPKKNQKAVAEICKEMDLHGSQEEIIEQVVNYFQENIPYTVRPGFVPKDEDVINFFLTKNKKGYCAHFASSAVLIFRYMGIPARYVEGYAVNYGQVLEGTITEENYEDYYQGYSPLGKTAVVEVEVSDASAHAWVEVFEEDFGWIPVEVTPSSSEDIEDTNDFWNFFGSLFGESPQLQKTEGNGQTESRKNITIDSGKVSTLFLAVCLAILVLCVGKVIRKIRFCNNKNKKEKLIEEYQLLCNILRYLDITFHQCASHKEQFIWMKEKFQVEEVETMASFMEEISYSQEKIEDTIIFSYEKKLIQIGRQIIQKLSLKEKIKVIGYFVS
ncbi:MAG: transglutaminase domain-containing protein [Lachnospiraceae bacterium]|nr:transglutaminase domain-containing protein [Lachnospiraceae bacterium]